MLKNFFVTAIRNFSKHKVFSVINILGLAIGISACLVICLIVRYDFSFDKFEQDRERIYRVVSEFKFAGQEIHNPGVPGPLATAVKNEVTGVASVIPLQLPTTDIKVTITGNNHQKKDFRKQPSIVFADDSYFSLVSYKCIAGTVITASSEPYQVVLTEERARLYFPLLPASDVIGKTIIYNDSIQTTVTGVVAAIQQHTDFSFKEFISRVTITKTAMRQHYGLDEWWGTDGTCQLFIKLSVDAKVEKAEAQLAAVMKKYRKDQKQTNQDAYVFKLQPLSDLHFNANFGTFGDWKDNGGRVASKSTLYGLLIIGVFLLVLGSVNFINLTTAQATQRTKEIGIRKTMGGSTAQLRWQFLSETFLITLLASALALAMVPLLLKIFEDFIPKGPNLGMEAYPQLMQYLLLLVPLVTLLSGFYPSLVLSRYNPTAVLKNQAAGGVAGGRKLWIRRSLTVSQFVIAQVFIMATLIVSKQINYTLNKDLGFKKEAVINFTASFNEKYQHNRYALLEKLKAIHEIAKVSLSNVPPSSSNQRSGTWVYTGDNNLVETHAQITFADTSYLHLYQLQLLAGRNINASDTVKELLINETYARLLGFADPKQVIGKRIAWKRNNIRYPVVGVLADFHQRSLHEKIQPQLLSSNASETYCFNILLQPRTAGSDNWKTGIAKVAALYKELYPTEDFEYNFLDETIAQFYTSEQHVSQLLKWATALAIFISCLGLLGLVIYTTHTRTKEIGVRKVLGASVLQIVRILSKDFIVLVAIAFLIATPIAWWTSFKWLQNFSYQTGISWWLFPLAGLSMVIVSLCTLSFQTIKAASVNPVKSLRTE